MSANHEKRDQYIYCPYPLNDFEKAMIEMAFEQNADADIYEINLEKKETKALKMLSVFKTILFPIEYPLTWVFLGKMVARERMQTQKLYWKYLTTKMLVKDFKIALNNIFKNSNIL